MNKKDKPLFITIPTALLIDPNLTAMEKLLAIEIFSLCTFVTPIYFAGNNHFSVILDVQPKRVSGLLSNLKRKGYISMTLDRKDNNRRLISMDKLLMGILNTMKIAKNHYEKKIKAGEELGIPERGYRYPETGIPLLTNKTTNKTILTNVSIGEEDEVDIGERKMHENEERKRTWGNINTALKHYKEKWASLYGNIPILTKGDQYALKHIIEQVPIDKVLMAIDGYFADSGQFVKNIKHPIGLFVKHINKYNIANQETEELADWEIRIKLQEKNKNDN